MVGKRSLPTVSQTTPLTQVPVCAKMQHGLWCRLVQNRLWLSITRRRKVKLRHKEEKALQNLARVYMRAHAHTHV